MTTEIPQLHTVLPGEDAASIAERYDLHVDQLEAMNAMWYQDVRNVRPGDVLIVREPSDPQALLQNLAELIQVAHPCSHCRIVHGCTLHMLQHGETVESCASAHRVSELMLKRLNARWYKDVCNDAKPGDVVVLSLRRHAPL